MAEFDTKSHYGYFSGINRMNNSGITQNQSIRKMVLEQLEQMGYWEFPNDIRIVVRLPSKRTIQNYETICKILLEEGWDTPRITNEQKSETKSFIEDIIRFNYDGEFIR